MKQASIVFAVSLLAYLLTAGGHLYSPDEEIMFRMTESLVVDRDLAIQPVAEGFATRPGIDGKEYAQYGIGQPILSMPFFLVGRALAPLAGDAAWARAYGLKDEASGGWWGAGSTAGIIAPRVAVSFFNILISALLAALLCLLLIELTGHVRASTLAAFMYALGSYAWAHSRPYYSEICAVLFVVLAWYALLRACRGRMAAWTLLAGAATGYAALVRMDSIILYPATALLLLGPVWKAAREKRPRVHPYILFCLPALACGGVLLLLNVWHFGGPFESGYADQAEGINFSTPLLAGLYGFLFSAGRGLFFFSPALVLGLYGWITLWRRDRWIMLATLGATLFPLCFMAKWQNWAGGWTWGPRHIFMIHPFLIIPAAFWLASEWNRLRRAVALALMVTGIAVQLLGASQDFIAYYSLYFRNTNGRYFRELYDGFDAGYWGQYYQVFLTRKNEPPMEIPMSLLPAPVQHSVYVPQYSAWQAYPRMMLEYGMFDNLWWRLATAAPDAAATAPPDASD